MRYIDLTTDFGFKRLFGRQENSSILQAFLTDILSLETPIVEVQLLTQEQLPETPGERVGIYDVYCKDAEGRRFIVEMQRGATPNFKERVLFYSTFPITQQIKKGTSYDFSLLPIYCICLLNYKMDDKPTYFRKIHLMDVQDCSIFYDKYTLVFIELPKFTLRLEELQAMMEKWLFLLKHSAEMSQIPPPLQEPPLEQAFEVAELAAMTEAEQLAYHMYLKRLSDNALYIQGQINLGLQQSLEKGIQEGIQIGKEEGKQEGIQIGEQRGIQIGERKGILSGIKLVVKIKFGVAGDGLFDEIAQVESLATLEAIQQALETATTIDEVRQVYLVP